MFADNLKTLRKTKGYTQEELASKLKVVRQTISKWEKGVSVPDAELLLKIADEFEVSVSELLGAKIEETQNQNEIAVQLAKLNEQLAIKNRRAKRVWITLLVVFIIIPTIVNMVMLVSSFALTANGQYFEEQIIEEWVTEVD